jgi:hypothetical protein
MSDCQWEEENLSVFVDGELPAGQQRALARHLLDCPECAAHAGRLLAVKYYLGAHAEEPAPLSAGFWARLNQALDLVDAVAERAAARRVAPAARRAWALAGAGVFLILAAWVLRLAALPPPVQPEALIRAHEGLILQVPQGPMTPAAWAPGQSQRAGRTWLPQARLDQALGATAISQHLYSVSSLPLSAFTLPHSGLAAQRLFPIRVGMEQYYVSAGDPTSLVAWRDGDNWQVLAADTPLPQLLSLAQVFSRTSGP